MKMLVQVHILGYNKKGMRARELKFESHDR